MFRERAESQVRCVGVAEHHPRRVAVHPQWVHPSRAAAERLGFRYEGVFRNHLVMKGRNRDTAWFSITEDEWPDIRQAFEAWLSPANFDNEGFQRKRLGDLMPASAGAPIVRDT